MTNDVNKKDCGWCREMYDRLTPFVQVAGFLLLAGSTIGVYHAKFDDMTAHAATLTLQLASTDARVSALENQYAHISQRLDDLCDFWKVPRRR